MNNSGQTEYDSLTECCILTAVDMVKSVTRWIPCAIPISYQKPIAQCLGILMIAICVVLGMYALFDRPYDVVIRDIDPRRFNQWNHTECYLLHKTHKSNDDLLTNRFLKAQREVDGYQDCQYVLLYWIDYQNLSDLSPEQVQNLTNAQQALGEENVFVVDFNATESAFGAGFFRDLYSAQTRPPWYMSWIWNNADIPEMVWAHHTLFEDSDTDTFIDEDDQSAIIWMMEYDVLWSGHLGDMLIRTISNHMDYTYVASKLSNNSGGHNGKRAPVTLYDGRNVTNLFTSLIQLVRFKPWILSRMIQQVQRREFVYCEYRAASICALGPEKDDCSMAGYTDEFPVHFRVYYNKTANIRWRGSWLWFGVGEEGKKRIMEEIEANNVTSRFFHAVK